LINVTRTYLPPLEEYTQYLAKIWESHHVTNHGPLVQELESRLEDFLGVRYLFFLTNGTIALQIAIKALGLRGDVLTTPFSYVATTSTIVWEGCRPVFVDIDPQTLTMDPERIEAAITPDTTAILTTHVYGYPCAVDQIREIGSKHGLRIIYDAAHAFGARFQGSSVVGFGDISAMSFHATKLFHTGEGGALVTSDDVIAERIAYMMNFGHKSPIDFWGLGINGKNSELHAAMGLAILPKVPTLIAERKVLCALYDARIQSSGLTRPVCPAGAEYNYAYYPVLFESEDSLLRAVASLNGSGIYPRRYFYPSLNTLSYVDAVRMPVSEDVSARVLCLPLSNYLTTDDIERICNILLTAISARK
jgi:dTDP-4-amino-4,6-dideoxygalactose transaminase